MKRNSHSRRFGFTIVEVLTILSVMSVMLSLTTPALQQAQEAAARTQCKNNLKQIGLALHNYHDVYNRFPASWFARHDSPDAQRWMGWQRSLLPYMEQAPLYNQISQSVTPRGRNALGINREPEWPTDEVLAQMGLPALLCPSDTTGTVNPMRGGFGTSNYSGNGGIQPFPRWYAGTTEQYWPGGVRARDYRDVKSQAIFKVNSCTGIRDITDGTSNTMMVAERSATSAAGIWMGVRLGRFENDAITEFSHQSGLNKSLTGASSLHEGGVQILLCDGSVRFLSENVDSQPDNTGILQKLATRAGGEPFGDF